MNVYEITKKYLLDNGYDGLYTDECGCLLDDLMPCCSDCHDIVSCRAGYKVSVEEVDRLGGYVPDGAEYIVWGKKPEVEDGKN